MMLSSMQGIKASSSDKQPVALVLGLPDCSGVRGGRQWHKKASPPCLARLPTCEP